MTPNENPPTENTDPIFAPVPPSETDMKPVLDENNNPVRKSHSNYYGMFDYNTNSFPRKDRLICRTYVGKSDVSGYGVFANEDIQVGELIEEIPAILLDTTFVNNKDWVLNRYAMTWECNCSVCRTNGKTMALMMGNGSMYNHSEKPNAYIIQDSHMKMFKIYALTPITKNTEITWYYGRGYAKRLRDERQMTHSIDHPDGLNTIIKSIQEGYQVTPEPKKKGCGCANKAKKTSNDVREVDVPHSTFYEIAEASTKRYEEKVKNNIPTSLARIPHVSELAGDDPPDQLETPDSFETFAGQLPSEVEIDQDNLKEIKINGSEDVRLADGIGVHFRSMVVPEKNLDDKVS
jgi:hypothetical protein